MHGSFPITRSVPEAAALATEIAKLYPMADIPYCGLASRNMADVFLVRDGTTQYAARVWRHEIQTEDEVRFQLDLLTHLSNNGLSVLTPVPRTDGTLYFSIPAPEGQRFAALFPWFDGDLLGFSEDHQVYKTAGELIAGIHHLGEGFRPRTERPFDLAGKIRRPLPAVRQMASHRPDDLAFLEAAVDAICEGLSALEEEDVPTGVVHGDFHAGNAIVTPDGTVVLWDFDCCATDWLCRDLLCFEWANDLVGIDQAYSDSFIEGYESVRPLGETERKHWPLLWAAQELYYLSAVADVMDVAGTAHMSFKGLDRAFKAIRSTVAAAQVM